MRKLTILFVALMVWMTSVHVYAAEASSAGAWLNTDLLKQGAVTVTYNVKPKVATKLMISKGAESYTYNLVADKKAESFPLQLGNGEYKIVVLEHVSGKSYKAVQQAKVTLNLKDDKVVYLNSVQNVSWTSTSKAIEHAKTLTKNLKTDEEKVKAVYNYVIGNIAYDNKLAASVPTDYLPSIDRTFATKKDICYGYSALFAAMLRSLDIPAKLVMGDSAYVDTYHAWNEVYLNGKWVLIDTTVDSGLKAGNKKIDWIKDAAKYTKAKQY